MTKFGAALILIVGLTGIRAAVWYETNNRNWRAGNQIGQRVRLEDTVNQNSQGYYFRYRNNAYYCEIKNRACERLKDLELGDELVVRGKVVIYKNRPELAIEQIESFQKVSRWSGWRLVRAIRSFRTRLDNIYKLTLSEPHASLLAGIVLGRNERMPEELYQALINTGTIHIVAASGFNVTIVAKVVLLALLTFFSRRKAVVMALISVLGYAILAGAGPPIVRAGIMGSLVFIAQALGRDYWAGWGLLMSSLLMLIAWPWLLTDVSFQLSVAATLGILWMANKIKQKIASLARGKLINGWADSLVNDLATTLAAGIATAPVIWLTFGRVAWISPIVNVLVLWLVAPLMGLGAVIAILGLVSIPLAQVIANLTWPLTQLMIAIILAFGD